MAGTASVRRSIRTRRLMPAPPPRRTRAFVRPAPYASVDALDAATPRLHTTDDELFAVYGEMLAALHDARVCRAPASGCQPA
ncbi:hypothetical protein AB0D94_20205 [Streptomyces sp. NPDC048255]|uniref:hypothetical protein n=1 Tax=Streptomyces sp. NPDC048255 TaxID=3154713 RepID=UPI0033C2B27D